LLAKQCWKLLQHHDSLAVGIMKAHDYPISSILDVELCKRSSFA